MICVFKRLRKEALSGAETGKREKTISILKKQNNCLIKSNPPATLKGYFLRLTNVFFARHPDDEGRETES